MGSISKYGPRYKTAPLRGRVNQLLKSQQFDDVLWTKEGATFAQNALAPDGTTTAWTMTETLVNELHRLYYTVGGSSVGPRSIFAKPGTAGFLMISGSGGPDIHAIFNLNNGTIATSAGGYTAPTMTLSANGFYRCAIYVNFTYFVIGMGSTQAEAVGNTPYLGTGKNVIIWGAQFEAGDGNPVTNYQRVTSASDYDTQIGVA